MTLILPPEHRAPFIAPGRRNRKVYWNRPLTKAMEQLGEHEREDFRRGVWLPKSLRMFYPKWNNRFSPGRSCDDCACGEDPCNGCSTAPEEIEATLASIANDFCPDCTTFLNDTFILARDHDTSSCIWRYSDAGAVCFFGGGIDFQLFIGGGFAKLSVGNDIVLFGEWQTTVSDPHDCAAISGLDLPFLSDDVYCDCSSSTCTLTAL